MREKRYVRKVFAVLMSLAACLCFLVASPVKAEERPSRTELAPILERFEESVERTRKEFKIPGMAVAVIQNDELVYVEGFGVREINGAETVNPETVFQIGSTSKAFTAALVASVVDEGVLGWKDPVRSHLPDFAMADSWVTENFQVRDLMAQHSGMKPYAGDVLVLLGYGREDVLRSMAHIEPVYSFRSEFSYVNNLWLAAAALVESKTGKSWEDNLKERILDPLGMSSSSCSMKEYLGLANAATLHVVSDGEVRPLGRRWPFFNWPYVYAPAGGINSNVLDMAKWVRFQLGDGTFGGKDILTTENLVYPHHPQTPISEKDSYCMGWVKTDYEGHELIWHNGETTGCKSLVMLVPELDLGIVILSN
ncbi:MAG: serine hydrolase domain-containing protein, partial [Thermovirgaceae bacterium]